MENDLEIFRCIDCKRLTSKYRKDYYMVNEYVWKKYGVEKNMLCIKCLEKRMKRKLKFEDLTLCPVNISNPYTRFIIKKYINDYENKVMKEITQANRIYLSSKILKTL